MKSKSLKLFLGLFLLSLVFIFCKRDTREAVYKVEFSEGVRVIHNFKKEVLKPIEFVEDLTLGFDSQDINYQFANPVDIDVDSKGNIYILDKKAKTIKKYDLQGKHIKDIGRAGQGPGEFEYPEVICIGPEDFLYCLDSMGRNIIVFDPEGRYLKTMNMRDFVNDFSLSRTGEIFINYQVTDNKLRNEIKRIDFLAKVDEQSNPIIKFFHKERYFYERIASDKFVFRVPLFLKWVVNSPGNIFIGSADKYELNVYSSSGSLLFKMRKDYQPLAVDKKTRKEIESILERLRANLFKEMKYVEFYQVFNSLSIDEKDRIWVELFQPSQGESPLESALFDVFSSEGIYLFSTRINKNVRSQLVFRNGYIYFLSGNREGYIGALRMRMKES